jgi:hypothetical protein
MAPTVWPRFVVMQYRCGKTKRNRVYAMVRTRTEAKAIVVHASSTRRNDNEFYVVVDGPKSAADPENTYFVGACCHTSKEIVLMENEEHPILMPVEIAKMYDGDESVKFLTDNRHQCAAPAAEEGAQE